MLMIITAITIIFCISFCLNDDFFPMDGGDVAQVNLFQIYDRWGALLFERTGFLTNDGNLGWNGTSKGQAMPTGTYVWILEVTFRDGASEMREGSVLLLR